MSITLIMAPKMSAHARTCENGAHRGHVGNHMKAPVSKTSAPKNMTRGSNRKTTSNRESNGEGPSRSQTLQETLLASEVSKDKEPEGVPTEDKGKQKEVLTHGNLSFADHKELSH
jgi:hypothetical protein